MTDTIRLPNGGYEIKLIRRKDVIESIDKNIIDKQIAYELIDQLEVDASRFLREGRWVGLPYLGNFKRNLVEDAEYTEEQKQLIEEAEKVLDKDRYCLFRKHLRQENYDRIKFNRFTNYITSIAINKFKPKYRYLAYTKGENYAKLWCWATYNVVYVRNEFVDLEHD